MATPAVAVGAAALGYFLLRQQCRVAGATDAAPWAETHTRTEQPPSSWAEALYLFQEALRCGQRPIPDALPQPPPPPNSP